MEVNCLNRVSPWEIELSGSASGSNSFVLQSTKRSRVGFSAAKPDFPFPRGVCCFFFSGFFLNGFSIGYSQVVKCLCVFVKMEK